MITKSPVEEYTTHDFSAVNAHVGEVYQRTKQITHHRRLDVFKRFAIYSAIIFAGLGLLAILAAIAYWIAFAPPKPKTKFIDKLVMVDKPIIVEKEIIIERPIDTAPSVPAELLERLEKIEKLGAGKGKDESKVIQNFTLFTSVEFELDGIISVVTGANFENSRSTYPSTQYCYVDIPIFSLQTETSAPRKNLDIAKKSGKEKVSYFPLTGEIASSAGTTISALKAAQKKCRFI